MFSQLKQKIKFNIPEDGYLVYKKEDAEDLLKKLEAKYQGKFELSETTAYLIKQKV